MSGVQGLADAAMADDAGTVRRLLANDPSLAAAYTDEGWTALHLAATPEIAEMLLDAGAGINARNRHKEFGPGNSPLSAAVYQDRRDVVGLLIERGADVNQGDDANWRPLHLAVANGRLETARMLLEAGASTNVRTEDAPGLKWARKTPLDLLSVPDRTGEGGPTARPEVDAEIAALLRQYGAES
jgi:ankyrin repeat protein